MQCITHQNEGIKDVYITTGVKISEKQSNEESDSCCLIASQNLYKVSEDLDFDDSCVSESIACESFDEDHDQLFPRSKKVIEFKLPKDFKTMLDSEGGYL